MLVFFKRYRMQFDLRNHCFDGLTPPPNFRLLQWKPRLVAAHAEAKFRSFRDELDANVFPCLGDADGCLKLMNDISGRSNFVPEATWLVAHSDPQREYLVNCGTVQGIMDGPPWPDPKHRHRQVVPWLRTRLADFNEITRRLSNSRSQSRITGGDGSKRQCDSIVRTTRFQNTTSPLQKRRSPQPLS